MHLWQDWNILTFCPPIKLNMKGHAIPKRPRKKPAKAEAVTVEGVGENLTQPELEETEAVMPCTEYISESSEEQVSQGSQIEVREAQPLLVDFVTSASVHDLQ